MDNTSRFNGHGKIYNEFRPEYPEKMFVQISKVVNLEKDNMIADIGTGTGKSAQWFLKEGYTVWGVEPSDMIKIAVKLKKQYPNFRLKKSTAENTELEKNSMDLIISGQAVQYFDIEKVKIEFSRILKNNGFVAIFWYNETEDTQFEKEYYNLIHQFRINDNKIDIRITRNQRIKELFGNHLCQEYSFKHTQLLNNESLIGRTLSSSHLPKEDTREGKRLISELETLLGNKNEFILNYETSLYIGKFK